MNSSLIKINKHFCRLRMRLTSENKPCLNFIFFQSVVNVHLHFSFDQPGPTSATNPTFACERKISALFQGCIHNGVSGLRKIEVEHHTIQCHFKLTSWSL